MLHKSYHYALNTRSKPPVYIGISGILHSSDLREPLFSMANMDNAEANAHIAALTAENEALRAEVAENAAALAAAEAAGKVLDKLPTTTIPGT